MRIYFLVSLAGLVQFLNLCFIVNSFEQNDSQELSIPQVFYTKCNCSIVTSAERESGVEYVRHEIYHDQPGTKYNQVQQTNSKITEINNENVANSSKQNFPNSKNTANPKHLSSNKHLGTSNAGQHSGKSKNFSRQKERVSPKLFKCYKIHRVDPKHRYKLYSKKSYISAEGELMSNYETNRKKEKIQNEKIHQHSENQLAKSQKHGNRVSKESIKGRDFHYHKIVDDSENSQHFKQEETNTSQNQKENLEQENVQFKQRHENGYQRSEKGHRDDKFEYYNTEDNSEAISFETDVSQIYESSLSSEELNQTYDENVSEETTIDLSIRQTIEMNNLTHIHTKRKRLTTKRSYVTTSEPKIKSQLLESKGFNIQNEKPVSMFKSSNSKRRLKNVKNNFSESNKRKKSKNMKAEQTFEKTTDEASRMSVENEYSEASQSIEKTNFGSKYKDRGSTDTKSDKNTKKSWQYHKNNTTNNEKITVSHDKNQSKQNELKKSTISNRNLNKMKKKDSFVEEENSNENQISVETNEIFQQKQNKTTEKATNRKKSKQTQTDDSTATKATRTHENKTDRNTKQNKSKASSSNTKSTYASHTNESNMFAKERSGKSLDRQHLVEKSGETKIKNSRNFAEKSSSEEIRSVENIGETSKQKQINSIQNTSNRSSMRTSQETNFRSSNVFQTSDKENNSSKYQTRKKASKSKHNRTKAGYLNRTRNMNMGADAERTKSESHKTTTKNFVIYDEHSEASQSEEELNSAFEEKQSKLSEKSTDRNSAKSRKISRSKSRKFNTKTERKEEENAKSRSDKSITSNLTSSIEEPGGHSYNISQYSNKFLNDSNLSGEEIDESQSEEVDNETLNTTETFQNNNQRSTENFITAQKGDNSSLKNKRLLDKSEEILYESSSSLEENNHASKDNKELQRSSTKSAKKQKGLRSSKKDHKSQFNSKLLKTKSSTKNSNTSKQKAESALERKQSKSSHSKLSAEEKLEYELSESKEIVLIIDEKSNEYASISIEIESLEEEKGTEKSKTKSLNTTKNVNDSEYNTVHKAFKKASNSSYKSDKLRKQDLFEDNQNDKESQQTVVRSKNAKKFRHSGYDTNANQKDRHISDTSDKSDLIKSKVNNLSNKQSESKTKKIKNDLKASGGKISENSVSVEETRIQSVKGESNQNHAAKNKYILTGSDSKTVIDSNSEQNRNRIGKGSGNNHSSSVNKYQKSLSIHSNKNGATKNKESTSISNESAIEESSISIENESFENVRNKESSEEYVEATSTTILNKSSTEEISKRTQKSDGKSNTSKSYIEKNVQQNTHLKDHQDFLNVKSNKSRDQLQTSNKNKSVNSKAQTKIESSISTDKKTSHGLEVSDEFQQTSKEQYDLSVENRKNAESNSTAGTKVQGINSSQNHHKMRRLKKKIIVTSYSLPNPTTTTTKKPKTKSNIVKCTSTICDNTGCKTTKCVLPYGGKPNKNSPETTIESPTLNENDKDSEPTKPPSSTEATIDQDLFRASEVKPSNDNKYQGATNSSATLVNTTKEPIKSDNIATKSVQPPTDTTAKSNKQTQVQTSYNDSKPNYKPDRVEGNATRLFNESTENGKHSKNDRMTANLNTSANNYTNKLNELEQFLAESDKPLNNKNEKPFELPAKSDKPINNPTEKPFPQHTGLDPDQISAPKNERPTEESEVAANSEKPINNSTEKHFDREQVKARSTKDFINPADQPIEQDQYAKSQKQPLNNEPDKQNRSRVSVAKTNENSTSTPKQNVDLTRSRTPTNTEKIYYGREKFAARSIIPLKTKVKNVKETSLTNTKTYKETNTQTTYYNDNPTAESKNQLGLVAGGEFGSAKSAQVQVNHPRFTTNRNLENYQIRTKNYPNEPTTGNLQAATSNVQYGSVSGNGMQDVNVGIGAGVPTSNTQVLYVDTQQNQAIPGHQLNNQYELDLSRSKQVNQESVPRNQIMYNSAPNNQIGLESGSPNHNSIDVEAGGQIGFSFGASNQNNNFGQTNQVVYQAQPGNQVSYEAVPSKQIQFEVAPSNQVKYETVPSNQVTYQVAPSNQIKYEVAPSNQVKYDVAPSNQVTYQVAPSNQVKYEIAPSHQATYQVAPSNQVQYEVSPSNQISGQVGNILSYPVQTLQNVANTAIGVVGGALNVASENLKYGAASGTSGLAQVANSGVTNVVNTPVQLAEGVVSSGSTAAASLAVPATTILTQPATMITNSESRIYNQTVTRTA